MPLPPEYPIDASLIDGPGQIVYAEHVNRLARAANSLSEDLVALETAVADIQLAFLNVKADFGAVGDGVANDYTAITNAISAIASLGGGVVYFPYGQYLTNLIISSAASNVWLLGSGQGSSTLKLANNVNNHLLNVTGNAWTVSNMGFDGNRANQTTGHVLRFSGEDHVFNSLFIQNAKAYGMGLAESTGTSLKRARLNNIYIINTGLDGIDSKDAAGENVNNTAAQITIKNWGLDQTQEAGFDCRGRGWHLSSIDAVDIAGDDVGIRFREGDGGITGWGCDGSSLTGFRAIAKDATTVGTGVSIASDNVSISNGLTDGITGAIGAMTGVSVGGLNSKLSNITARNGGIGYLVSPTGGWSELTNCNAIANRDGYRIDSDNVTIDGGSAKDNLRYGLNPNPGVGLRQSLRFSNNLGNINSTGVIPSQAALNIPSYLDVWHVSGTTGVTSIVGEAWVGREVILIFDDVLTLTEGSNLKLNGNLTTAPGDSVALRYDGTNWYEITRPSSSGLLAASGVGVINHGGTASTPRGTDFQSYLWLGSVDPTNSDDIKDIWFDTTTVGADWQPLDADLTAIAALSTQSFGRSLLTQADAASARSTLNITPLTTTVVTSASPVMPASPANNDMVIYYDSTQAIMWQFRYRAAQTAWFFVGGAPLMVTIDTLETTVSTTYAALTTAGPSITVPFAGDYDVRIECSASNNTVNDGARMSFDVGATGAIDADSIFVAVPSVNLDVLVSGQRRKTGLAASTALVSKYKAITGGTATFRFRRMMVTPIKVT